MALFTINVSVSLQDGILDPKGKATLSALHQLGFTTVESARINKSVTLRIDASSQKEALEIAAESAQKLLANPVTESFSLSVV
jgi:phosphoribosylformylglycinamidine synthase PurS subunit